MNNKPRILLIGTNALSAEGSNGKVADELLKNWPRENLAQFFISNEYPNSAVCSRFYRITDREALKAILFRGNQVGNTIENKPKKEANTQTIQQVIQKNPLTCLLRDLVWKYSHWYSKNFKNWLKEYNPEIILLQIGISSYVARIAIRIANDFRIPIVIYNTENYYFKKFNYFHGSSCSFFYPLYRFETVYYYRKLMKHSAGEIYTNDALKELYDREFHSNSILIYQATSLKSFPPKEINKVPVFMYAGNLGIGRHEALLEVGKVLHSLSQDYVLDIYGKAPSEEIAEKLKSCDGVRYHGVVSYDEVIKMIEKSDFLVHAESFEPFRVMDLQTAFSTKISDYLASGRCFILYADEALACTQYLLDHECACVITNQDELASKLISIISNKELRLAYIEKSKMIAEENHNAEKNSKKFGEFIADIMERHNENLSN